MVTIVDVHVGDTTKLENAGLRVSMPGRVCGVVVVTGEEDELKRLSDECSGEDEVFERDGKYLLEIYMSDLNAILTRFGNKEL